jgi:hypothetical protein
MRFGVSLPPFGDFADVRLLAEAARRAEEAGWDGFFVWDHVFFDPSFHPIDAVHAGRVPDRQWDRADDVIDPFADLGITWWIEDVSPWRFGHPWEIQWSPDFTKAMHELIMRGPPRYRRG